MKFTPSEKLEALGKVIAAKRAEANALYDTIGDADPTADQVKSVKDLNKTIEEEETKYRDLFDIESGKSANATRLAELREPIRAGGDYAGGEGAGAKSLGAQVLEDPAFKSFVEANAARGQSQKGVDSPRVQVKSLLTGASDTSAGAMVRREYDPMVPLPFRPLTIRDLVDIGQTGSDLIEYVVETLRVNNAAVVAEATATVGASGTKPESGFSLDIRQATVKTIATWIPATRRALADAAQLRSMIDGELRQMVNEKLETQILVGDGVGENFVGVLNTPGLTAQAFSGDRFETMRKARTKCRFVGRAVPTAYVMNPIDVEAIDLAKDDEGRYYYGGPAVMGNRTVWGVPVVEHEDMTQGRAILGDWKVVKVWDRQLAEILTSDSHADFFVRNLIAVLAELRAAMGVKRPAALVDTHLTA